MPVAAVVLAALVSLPSRGVAQPGEQDGGVGAQTDGGVLPSALTSDRESTSPAPVTALPAPSPSSDDDRPPVLETVGADLVSTANYQELSSVDLEAMLQYTVVTATKSQLKEEEAPAITMVVNRDEILRWGYQSIEEVLEHVAGLYVVNDHIIPNLAVRGISGGLRAESGLVKVMIDGRSVAFRSTAGNWLGAELVPLSVVQQIEVIRGPASSLYGADAFLGVINIVTRTPEQMEGGQIGLGGNREGGYGWNGDMALGASTGNWRILVSLRSTREDRSGLQLPVGVPSPSPAPKLSGYAPADLRAGDLTLESTVGLARVSYRLGTHGMAGLWGYYSSIDRGAEFADWAQLTHRLDSSGRENGTNISLRQGMLGLDLDLHLTRTVDLRVNGSFFAGGPTARDRIDVHSESYYVKRDFGYRGFDAEAEVAWRPRETFTVLVGGGMILDHEKLPMVYDVLKASLGTGAGERAGDRIPTTEDMGNKNLINVGANALITWSPFVRLNITAGGRYDHHSVYGGKLSGRLGGVVTLSSDLHVKLLYGSAFKAPSPQLLYGSPLAPGDISGNLQLKPSYVHTVESQLVYRPFRYVLLTSGVAYSYLLDQAAFAQRGTNQVAVNISRVRSLSWETEARLDYRKKLAAYGNVSVNHTVPNLSGNNYVGRIANYSNAAYPVVIANLGASAEIPRLPLRVSAEISYLSGRRSSSANTLEAGQWYTLPAYFVAGGSVRTVGLHLLPQKEVILMLVMRNLADAKYAAPGFAGVDYPQLGRTFILHAIQEF